MFDTRDQILNQLRAGEDGRAEFKEVRLGKRGVVAPNAEDLAGELVAFANADGDVVFLGVCSRPSGAVRGSRRWNPSPGARPTILWPTRHRPGSTSTARGS